MDFDYKNLKGFLKKKSPHLLAGWQKRFFRVIDGKVIVYSEKENDPKPKGHFQITQISKAISMDKKSFSFNLEGRDFALQAEDEETKDKWIKVINQLIDDLKVTSKKTLPSPHEPGEQLKRSGTFSHKIDSLDKTTLDLLKNHGMMNTEEVEFSKSLLAKKNIEKLLNFKDPKVLARVHYGFLYKQHKTKSKCQKRWFFLYSSRPLTNEKYESDDVTLDDKKLKEWLKFDALFYFKYEGDKAASNEAQGFLDLALSHKIESIDKDNKYYLILDVEDRVYELYSDMKGDRDKWFEVLKNSRRTAKEFQVSITKHPRNVQLLDNLHKDPAKFKEKLDEEKTKTVGDYTKIKDYEILAFTLTAIENEIEATLDGCISNNPPKTELLTAYAENMNTTVLLIIQKFWDNHYKEIDSVNMINLAMNLFDFEERLKKLRVIDTNFCKNAKEFIKIAMKKQYKNILDVIGNILKMEREKKAIKGENGYYITNAPTDLFNMLSKSFESMRKVSNKFLFTQLLETYHECLIQYLIGVDCVISNYTIQVDKEFLLAIANNSERTNHLLHNSLIEEFKKTKQLTDKEINEALRFNHLMSSINLMTTNSLSRLVTELSENLEKEFNDHFLALNVTQILVATKNIFGQYNSFMSPFVKKKCWEEILKLTVFLYIKSLLTTAYKKVKKVDELINKLNDDKSLLFETYEIFVGQNLTETNLKIISDVIDFLNISSFMISSSCLTLREYMGSSFDLSMAKAFINLRCDFSAEDKKDAISQCKEVLDSYTDKGNKAVGGFFSKMQQDIKNEIEEDENGLDQIVDEKEQSKQQTVVFSLDDFLNNDEANEEEDEKEEQPLNQMIKEEAEEVEISDILYQGTMKKKSHSKWQERFFQLKNGYLYWFKDKTSSIVQNKISIKNTLKIESHKDCKFMMIVREDDSEKDKKDKEAGGKVYKFSVTTDQLKEGWVMALTNEMKRLKGQEYKSQEALLEIKAKKKVINDLYKLPEIGKDRNTFKSNVNSLIQQENYFKPVPKKEKMIIKKGLFSKKTEENIVIQKTAPPEVKPVAPKAMPSTTTEVKQVSRNSNVNQSQSSNISSSITSPPRSSQAPAMPKEQFHIEAHPDNDDDNVPSSCFGNCFGSFLLLFKK